jgi:histidinol-phosphate aminotransferase
MRLAPALDDIVAYEPGQPIEPVMRRFGLSEVVKLASMESPQPPFPEDQAAIVAAMAQAAAIEALKHQDEVALRRDENARQRDDMVAALAARGRATVPSEANFMLVDTRDLCHPHEEVCGVLLSMGAIVRDGTALGCPGWARVSVGTQSEIDFFLQQLAALEVDAQQDVQGR